MKLRILTLSCSALVALSSGSALAATILIDDFETSEGHFNLSPTFSGTTTGEAVPGTSTADRVTDVVYQGEGAQRIFLDDDPNVDVASTDPIQTWRLRHLSGGGTPANNLTLQNTATGYVGYYLLSSTPNLQASIMLDDGTGLERAAYLPIIADGQWHLYEWQFSDASMWEPFAGTGANGEINAATVTIDSIFINAIDSDPLNLGPDQDAVFYIDAVATDPDGNISVQVPEPSSAVLLSLAIGAAVVARRRRV